jgi:predicted  nucleic acid-binding Zn-ribbon protein
MNEKCANCGKEFERPSNRRKTCSDSCRKQYQRRAQSIRDEYRNIMSALNRLQTLTKSHPHLRPKIAEILGTAKHQIDFVSRMTGDKDKMFLNEMREGMARKTL